MSIKVEQSYDAHTKKINAQGVMTSAEIPYVVFGAVDEDEALQAVRAAAPSLLGIAPLNSIEIDSRENDTTYKVNAVYEFTSANNNDENQESTVNFDCGGGTRHLSHALAPEIRAYGSRPAGGAIGWNGKSGSEMEIAGVDIPTAQLRETYTRSISLSRLTTQYKRNIALLVGRVNSDMFKGWYPGEVMFLGASYSTPEQTSTRVIVSFNFAIQPNEVREIVPGISASKKGWEYIWALTNTEYSQDGYPITRIDGVYIDQVCHYASFAALGL